MDDVQWTHMYFRGYRMWILKGPVSSKDGCHRCGVALFICTHTQTRLPHELPLFTRVQPHWNLLNEHLLKVILASLQEAL